MKTKDLKEALQKMSYNELVDTLMEYAKKDKAFAKAFYQLVEDKLKAGGEEDAREEVDNSFSQMRPMGGRYDRYDDTDWYAIMEDRDELFQKAKQALEMGNLRRAVAYPLQWLNDFSEEFTEAAFGYDDEGAKFGWACEEAMEIIEKVMLHPQADTDFKEEVSDELSMIAEEATVFDDYCFVNLKSFASRMEAMTQSPEKALSTVEALIEKNEFGVKLSDLIIQKGTILMTMGKYEEALRFWENNVCEENVCSYLVNYLIGKKDYEQALTVLEKAIRQGERYESWQWLRKEIEIYETLGQKEQLIATHRRLFIEHGGEFKSYEALKSLIPAEEWKGYLASMMGETNFSDGCWSYNGNMKANILLAEQDLDGLFEYLQQAEGHSVLELYEQYAKKLPSDKQPQLIPNYLKEIRQEASEAKKRDHYSMVRYHISNLKELDGADEAVSNLLSELRELYRRRPAFMDELRKLD